MAALITAINCPLPTALSALILVGTSMDTAARVAKNVPATVTFRQQINQNAALLDLVARGGGGMIGVMDGPDRIVLSLPTSGLQLQVSAGHAMIGGPVEIPAATFIVVPNPATRVWIWLSQSGALSYTTTITPPAGEVCLLGSCVTSGGNVTSVDTSGVVYLRGGFAWRETADVGAPTDTPPSTVMFVAKTATGAYLWTGTNYRQLDVPLVTVDPTTPQAGDLWYRTDTGQLSFRAGVSTIRFTPGGAGGTVTSVSVNMPPEFTSVGNPITTSGAIFHSWQTQPANLTLVSPPSGAADVPSFRHLLPADTENFTNAGNSGTAKTLDLSLSLTQKVTMTGNCTFTFSNPAAGAVYYLILTQDATGSRTATWPATVKWPGGTAPTLTTTASKTDVIRFVWDGTNYYGLVSGQNY